MKVSPLIIVLTLIYSLVATSCSKENATNSAADTRGAALTGMEIPDYPATKISAHAWVIHGPTEIPNPGNKGFYE